jgi:predicted DNA-binding mobile mystery protein A
MKSDVRQLARQRLDERLKDLKPADRFQPPPKGWLRAIRNAFGMSRNQLASRLHVRPQTVEAMEKSEANSSVQLSTLIRAAKALDCTLVYAFVPNTTLEDTVKSRARKIAIRDLQRVDHTMKLEAQETSNTDMEARIEAYIRSTIKDRDLWNET